MRALLAGPHRRLAAPALWPDASSFRFACLDHHACKRNRVGDRRAYPRTPVLQLNRFHACQLYGSDQTGNHSNRPARLIRCSRRGERSEEAILVQVLSRAFAVLVPDHGVVLYGVDFTRHLARASQRDLPADSTDCVPMAIWRLVVRVPHRRPCKARATSHDGDPVNTSVETM